MAGVTKQKLEEIKEGLTTVTGQIAGNKTDLENQLNAVKTSLDSIAAGVGRIEEEVKKDPPDPVHRKALQQVPALTKSLSDVASGLKRTFAKGACNRPGGGGGKFADHRLVARNCLSRCANRTTTYGKIAAEIISAIQGLVNFVATILDLTHPKKKEPSIADVVANAIGSAVGRGHSNLLTGVLNQLQHMEAGLDQLHQQKDDPTRHRTFENWSDVWKTVELPAGEGVNVRVDSMPSWLMDENNLSLDPDPLGEVFYLYLLAKGQYLRNWLSAMLLLNTWDAKNPDPGKPTLINGDFLVAQAQLNSVVKTEQTTLRALVPFAVRKAVGVIIGSQEEIISSQKGFALEKTEWPNQKLSGGSVKKVVAGPEGRVWSIHNVGELYCYKLDGQGKQLDFFRYPPPNHPSELTPVVDWGYIGVPHWGDICVALRGRRASEVHLLDREYKLGTAPECYFWDEDKVGDRQPWDRTFYDKMQQGPNGPLLCRYFIASPANSPNSMLQIAATPAGYLYCLTKEADLWYWDATPTANSMRRLDGPSIRTDGKDVKLSSGAERVYIFANQDIWYKSHADIARSGNRGWIPLEPPAKAPENKPMPDGWFYKSVTESEGGAILASIELPSIGKRFYMWHDGQWEVGSDKLWGEMLVTLPLDGHHTFKALRSKVAELLAPVQPA
jgi:hypothetical protein